MAMAKKDRNTRFAEKAFEMVDKVNGKSQKIIPKPYVPRDEFPSQFIDHANRIEKPKERAITCDEAVKLYGGVLIKEFRN
ncbi:unnamed protein product [Arabis nemorensis]|uniref:Uncharacterized protein n=1 Tax=Arabis nemorensis TaxID=586526 RepID=A0A565C5R0_9BRAS|nr:unnamed protein product [Arabis nemorensis]